MEGTLIAFRLARVDKNVASELVKRRVRPRTSSHGGTCVVRRKGLLDEIPYARPIRGVVIVRNEDAGRVERFLAEMGAEVHARTIQLTRGDTDVLGGEINPRRRPRRPWRTPPYAVQGGFSLSQHSPGVLNPQDAIP